MSTPVDPQGGSAAPVPEPVPQGLPTDAQIRELAAQLQSTAADANPGALAMSQGVITATDPNAAPPTCTVTLSGSTTEIPGVRYMAYYSPVVQDTVQVLLQNGSMLVIGHIADIGTATATTGGFAAPTLSSGFTTNGNSNGAIMYRLVMDNGLWKMVWQGSVAHTGTNTTVVAAGVLPVESRPSAKRTLAAARSTSEGAATVQINFNTDGSVALGGATNVPSMLTTSGATNSVDTQSTVTHSHGATVSPSTITHDDGTHFHTVNNHSHANQLDDPTWISFNGLEYYL